MAYDIVKTCYISCACNRTSHCIDWGYNGLACFGACHAVALCDLKHASEIISTFTEHKNRVNTVRWIRIPDGVPETEFISSSLDKSAILWRKNENNECMATCRLVGHNGSVTAVDAVYIDRADAWRGRLLVVTASADSTVKIWRRQPNECECVCSQTIPLGNGLIISVSIALLPHSSAPLLACGRDDSKIYIYTEQQGQFVTVQVLAGHEQWVRDLSFTVDDNDDVLLASCGQDCYIRLWRICKCTEESSSCSKSVANDLELKLREATFSITDENDSISTYAIKLESVLHGHENWVSSVRWHPLLWTEGKRHQPLSLLSASMDKSVIIWEPHAENGIWMEKVRVGEVGGSNLGFYGSLFSDDGKSILAHGYQGAIHMWQLNEETGSWFSTVTCGGHFGPVNDLVWGHNGEFILSVSSDQTTRLHSQWHAANTDCKRVWHEIARPQIHGYDLQCIDLIDRFTFASGADEKVLRVFSAPKNFLENFRSINQADVSMALKKMEGLEVAQGASVPALGLSNKAVYTVSDSKPADCENNSRKSEQYTESYFSPQNLSAPPSEETLLQNTLWPEMQKLYGHGNEVYAVASSPDGTLLASACKATKPDQAAVILWDTATWRPLCRLESHTLTVTQIAFSHNGLSLLTVSRDRTWALFQRRRQSDPVDAPLFSKVASVDKKTAIHSRIIWSCSWSHDDKYFVTASRDKKAVIWSNIQNDTVNRWHALSLPLDLGDSITAVDFASVEIDKSRYLLALGVECGAIHLATWTSLLPQANSSWHIVFVLSQNIAHHLSVKRLRFCSKPEPNDIIKLASCAEDNTVKVFDVNFVRIRSSD